jgi:hypothetical protein
MAARIVRAVSHQVLCPTLVYVKHGEQAIKDLQDTLIVISEIEKRQSAMLRDHAEHLGELLEFRRRTDRNLAEITDKLNGLIGYVDGTPPPSQ